MLSFFFSHLRVILAICAITALGFQTWRLDRAQKQVAMLQAAPPLIKNIERTAIVTRDLATGVERTETREVTKENPVIVPPKLPAAYSAAVYADPISRRHYAADVAARLGTSPFFISAGFHTNIAEDRPAVGFLVGLRYEW